MQKAVYYHGILLMPGSEAYELYHSKEKDAPKKLNVPAGSGNLLEKHMKELEQKNKELIKRYE